MRTEPETIGKIIIFEIFQNFCNCLFHGHCNHPTLKNEGYFTSLCQENICPLFKNLIDAKICDKKPTLHEAAQVVIEEAKKFGYGFYVSAPVEFLLKEIEKSRNEKQ